MKRLAVFCSTGSIGQSTLSICESYPHRFSVVTMAAGGNVDLAFEQCKRWKPKVMSVAAEADANKLRARLTDAKITGIEVAHGSAGNVLVATSPEVDFLVSAI